ncbi:MAG: hypothetical protein EA385_16860 [Salinarimonadaceae bacterium]|nr:MAG: hypothetical protein EA385_16860 [Salinarimonadaceae bacterium]
MIMQFLQRDPSGALPETEAEKLARVAYERALIEEARADLDAGRVVRGDEAEAALEAFVRGEPLQIPDAKASPRPR